MRHYKQTSVMSVVFALFLIGGLLPAQQAGPVISKRAQPLVPVFSTALDSPTFTFDYVNDTNEAVVIPDLLLSSSATLDGEVFPSTGVLFVGNANLSPGRTIPLTITLAEYLPNWERKGYSDLLKRWRWKAPLKSGKHTLLIKFADKEYGPVTFLWDGDTPLLYE
jgi:hypothetical protein